MTVCIWDVSHKGSSITLIEGLRRIASGGSSASWSGTGTQYGGATVSSLLSDTYTPGDNATIAGMQFNNPGGNGTLEIVFATAVDFVGFFMDIEMSGVSPFTGFHFTVSVWDSVGLAYSTVYTGTSWASERYLIIKNFTLASNATKIKVIFTAGASIGGTTEQAKLGGFGPITSYGADLTFKVPPTIIQGACGTVGHSTGKFYFEVQQPFIQGISTAPNVGVALASANMSAALGSDVYGWCVNYSGTKIHGGSSSASPAGYSTRQVIGIYMDLDAHTMGYTIDGVDKGVIFSGLAVGTYYPAASLENNTILGLDSYVNGHFKAADLTYSPPTGYSAWEVPAPVASFTVDTKFGIAPLTVQFSDTSTNTPTSWAWDFGDGSTSTEQNPSHPFTLAGYYTVALTVTNLGGSDTYTSTFGVVVRSVPTPFPRIAWDNALASDDATLSASSEAAGYPKENAVDWRPYTWWKPTASGVSWLNAHYGSAVAANCMAIYAHTLGAAGATVKAQFSVDGGSTYYDATPSVAPAGTEAIYLVFPYCERADWRLYIDAASAAPVVGCVFIGVDMTLERGSRPSSPAMFNRDNVITNTVSQNGIWLGRSLISRGWLAHIALDFLTESFVRDSWLPFVEHAELKPWFLLWDELTRYTEAAWCFADGAIPGSQYTSATLMNAAIKAKAYIE